MYAYRFTNKRKTQTENEVDLKYRAMCHPYIFRNINITSIIQIKFKKKLDQGCDMRFFINYL